MISLTLKNVEQTQYIYLLLFVYDNLFLRLGYLCTSLK